MSVAAVRDLDTFLNGLPPAEKEALTARIDEALDSDNEKAFRDIYREINLSSEAIYSGIPVLWMAIEGESYRIARFLLAQGADINMYARNTFHDIIRPSVSEITLLIFLAVQLLEDQIQFALRHGANPTLVSKGKPRWIPAQFASAEAKEVQQQLDDMEDEADDGIVELHESPEFIELADRMAVAEQIIPKLMSPMAFQERRLAQTKKAMNIRRAMRNITGALSVRGRVPQNVVRGRLLPFLDYKPQRALGRHRVKPTEVGLRHVNTSLFQNGPRSRATRRRSRSRSGLKIGANDRDG